MGPLTLSNSFSCVLGDKKAPEAIRFKGDRTGYAAVPPCFAAASRKRPLRVPTHSCAVTCAHVVTYAFAVGHATPRPCSASPSVPVSTHRGSLCRICLLTLLFIVFGYELVIWYVVYTLSLFLSTVEVNRNRNRPSKKLVIIDNTEKLSVERAGIGLKGEGKTVIIMSAESAAKRLLCT